MRSRRLPLLTFAGLVTTLIDTARPMPLQPLFAATIEMRADTDTVIPARVEQVVALPLPIPDSIRSYRLTACFDVDRNGHGTLLEYNRPRDAAYNRTILRMLQEYRFQPSTLKGTAIRDTICVRAAVGNK